MWHGQTWSFTRAGVQDKVGDRSAETTFTVDGCIFWPDSETVEDFARDTVTSHGTLAVPDTADVLHTDRSTSPEGRKFTFAGLGRWGEAHPLTGWRPGYKVFRLKGVS